jgi:HEAT repeat protein
MRLLKDTNFDIRITVVLALGEMKNPISVSSLIEALSDETCQVRFGAATALDNIGWKPENKAEKIKYIYAKGQWDCIDELRVPVMSLLIEGLKEDNNDFRNRIVWHIGNLRYSGAVESLIPMLKIPDIQGTAIEALANIGDEKIACPLIELLADGDEPLKDNITNALTKIGTSSVEHLIDGLKHKNKDIRKYSAKALGKIKDTRAVEQLIQMLNDSEYQVRWEAILAIGNIGDKKAMAPLVQIVLHETDPGISSRAREALWKMKDPVLTDMFIMALNNNNIDIQTTAVWSLMGLKDPRAIEPLALLANDIKTNEKVRNDAKQAIEYIRKPK